MQCPQCRRANPDDAKFCLQCGAAVGPQAPALHRSAFGSARRALLCAIALQRAFAAYSARHADEPIRVRVGLHTGEALRDADKFFGKTVILAARIAAQAKGGEILVSSLFKELTQSTGDIHFGDGRLAELKGIAEPQPIFTVHWQSPGTRAESLHHG